jgi:CBS domain-containing protein
MFCRRSRIRLHALLSLASAPSSVPTAVSPQLESRNLRAASDDGCRGGGAVDRRFSVVRDLLDALDCGCISIVDHDAVVGMVTDRDIALDAAEADKSPSQLRLSQIITSKVFVVRPNAPIAEAEQRMREQKPARPRHARCGPRQRPDFRAPL